MPHLSDTKSSPPSFSLLVLFFSTSSNSTQHNTGNHSPQPPTQPLKTQHKKVKEKKERNSQPPSMLRKRKRQVNEREIEERKMREYEKRMKRDGRSWQLFSKNPAFHSFVLCTVQYPTTLHWMFYYPKEFNGLLNQFLTKKWQREMQQRDPSLPSFLLQVPPEILLYITSFLNSTTTPLSSTCKLLNHLFHSYITLKS